MTEKISFGFDWDSQYLRGSFQNSEYFSVGGGEDFLNDCPNDDFYFSSSLFIEEEIIDGVVNKNAVRNTNAKAKYFEKLMQGALNMLSLDHPRKIVFRRDHIELNEAPRPFLVDYLSRVEYKRSEALVRHALIGLAVDSYAFLLLTMEKGNAWANWFKVFESIKTEYPSPTKRKPLPNTPKTLLVDDLMRQRFEYSANNSEVSGLEARHGRNGWAAAKTLEPLTRNDAHDLIKNLMIAYANQKLANDVNWKL